MKNYLKRALTQGTAALLLNLAPTNDICKQSISNQFFTISILECIPNEFHLKSPVITLILKTTLTLWMLKDDY